jgi:hypothetical protein
MSYGQNTRATSNFSRPVETGEYMVDIQTQAEMGRVLLE